MLFSFQMDETKIQDIPGIYPTLEQKCKELGFTMPSDVYSGSLLKTLVASKRNAHILELGTGISLTLSWMIDGLDGHSTLISIDNDPQLMEIAKEYFGKDNRVQLICTDGSEWIKNYQGEPFDLIFADTWPGKYHTLEETLELLKPGGIYMIDDMNPQPNWPEGHAEKAERLTEYLKSRDDLTTTMMNWSTGIILCTKLI